MSSPLVHVNVSIDPRNPVGCPILANGVTATSVPYNTLTQVLAVSSDLESAPYKYQAQYPLLIKFFFTNIVLIGSTTTPEFVVTVSGPCNITCQRYDTKDFALTQWVPNWTTKSLTTSVITRVYTPLTSVTMSCMSGLATDTQDRAEEL